MTYQTTTTDRGLSGGLRAADTASRPVSRLAAGPFDISAVTRGNESTSLADALITGMLVVYPVVATVVAVMVGLVLSGPVA